MRVHRRPGAQTHRLADVPHRRRAAVLRRVLLDEVEDLLLALRQVLPDVHYGPLLLVSWLGSEHLFDTVAGGQDGRKRDGPAGLYSARTRADGGIGRRARLRAWSGITGWRFESSSAHHAKAPHVGAFVVLGLVRSDGVGCPRDNATFTARSQARGCLIALGRCRRARCNGAGSRL